jgi:hypothetical protein
MSATLKGFSFSDVKPQPGFTATRQENGGYIGRHSFAISRAAWESGAANQFSKGQPITSFDDSLPFSWNFLKIVETEIVSEEGDIVMIAVTLSGAQGASYGEDDEAPDPTYRLSGQLQDAPLSMHPKWAALSDIEKAGLALLIRGQAEYDLPTFKVGSHSVEDSTFNAIKDSTGAEIVMDSEDAKEFALRIARGETTYSRPVITWTESAQGTDGLTNAQLNKLGNISTPRGDPPEASGARDWMLTSAFQEQRGDLFTTDLEWTLSEKGGHDAFLYEE